MTTKQVLKLNKVISLLEEGVTAYQIEKDKVASKTFIVKVKRKMGEYVKYTSLIDGTDYWSEYISLESQVANFCLANLDYIDNSEINEIIFKAIISVSNLNKTPKQLKENFNNNLDDLFLVDLENYDVFENAFLVLNNITEEEVNQTFSTILEDGTVRASNFYCKNINGTAYENDVYSLVIKLLRGEKLKKLELNSDLIGFDGLIYKQKFVTTLAWAIFLKIKTKNKYKRSLIEKKLFLKMNEKTYVDSNSLREMDEIVIPNLIYWRVSGYNNLKKEHKEIYHNLIKNNKKVASAKLFCHIMSEKEKYEIDVYEDYYMEQQNYISEEWLI